MKYRYFIEKMKGNGLRVLIMPSYVQVLSPSGQWLAVAYDDYQHHKSIALKSMFDDANVGQFWNMINNSINQLTAKLPKNRGNLERLVNYDD